MIATLSLIVPALTPAAGAIPQGDAVHTVGRPIEWVSAATDAPVGARNQAVRAARGELCAFQPAGEPLDGPFLEQACRLLDSRAELSLVTGFGDRVPAALGGEPAPLTEAALLARPMASHVPTVFRRAVWERVGGCDHTLPAGAEPDLWLRVLDLGMRGAVVEAALPSGRALFAGERDWRPFWERHGARLARSGRAALLAKERIYRELEQRARVVHRERLALAQWRALLERREAQLADLERARTSR